MAIGRISGPLLKANLVRNGIDLAFETDLLYLDVNNNRIGIKTSAPQYELDVNGTTRTTNLVVTSRADIGAVNIVGNTISSDQQYLNLGTLDNVIYQNKLRIDSIELEGNVISTNDSNANLEFRPNGTGRVEVYSNMEVDGNIHATGNISADGSITLGNEDTDDVVFNAEVASDIIPNIDITYDLGSASKRWNDLYVKNIVADGVNTDDLIVDGIDLTLRQGKIWYVATNGGDTKVGNHPQDPYATIKKALSVAQPNDTVYVYPGIYTEIFPLTIPVGVAVKGQGIRSVKIIPTVATQNNDAVLLNGETTIEDLTIADFYSPGYSFKFAPGFAVTSRSPYIRNVSVITKGSVITAEDPQGFNAGDAGRGGFFDGAVAISGSYEAGILFHSVTFITPGVDAVVLTNGVRAEWLSSFTYFANRSIFAYDSASGLYGAGKTRIRLAGVVGTFAAGDTVTFTSTDASTVVSLLIDSVENNIVAVAGKNTDLIGFDTSPATISNNNGATATAILNIDLQDFGAEVRLIGSASVYGNFGLVGDGPGVLMYAIGHNLAYIGNGKAVTNDASTVIQANEVVEINDAKIRHTSMDHRGNFRVGDLFHVDQDAGTVVFSVSDFDINATGGVTFSNGSSSTFINGAQIDTGAWRISGNTVETLSGNANFQAASGEITLDADVNITGNLDVTGNVTVGGNIVIGDEETDTIQIIAGIDSDIVPKIDNVYSLGTSAKTWSNLFVNQVDVDDIEIRDNYIRTTASNSDLELRANGTGIVLVPSNNVEIVNGLSVGGTTTLSATVIQGAFSLSGDFIQIGDYTVAGNLDVGQRLKVGAAAQFEEILIDDNFITTTTSNTNLELRANGTGVVLVPNNNVVIANDLTVAGNIAANNINIIATLTALDADIGDIRVSGTTVESLASNADLELRANGAGQILVPLNDVVLGQDLTVQGTTDLQDLTVTGTVAHTGAVSQIGNYTVTGSFSNGNISIDSNSISTTVTNSDLELRANGTGNILVPNNNVTFSLALTVDGTTDLQATSVTGTIAQTGSVYQIGNFALFGEFTNGDILIEDNFITTSQSNSDLELRANGTGVILVPNNDVEITNNFTVNGFTSLQNTEITGTLAHTGPAIQIGNFELTGNAAISGTVTVSGAAQFEDIRIENNTITTTQTNSNLQLGAAGSGIVMVPNNNVEISNDLTVGGTITVGDINSSGTITANRFSTGNILIDDNFITTTDTNSDLELRANGTGTITVPSNDVEINQGLTVSGNTDLRDLNITGSVAHIGNAAQTGNFELIGALDIIGTVTVSGTTQFEDVRISGNTVTTTQSNSNLNLTANGSGTVSIPNNDVAVAGTLSVSGVLFVGAINSTGTITANNFTTGDILIDDNFITTTTSNSNLELRANGNGNIALADLLVNNSTISSASDITFTPGSQVVIINATGALRLPIGTTAERPAATAGQIRFNSELNRYEGYNGVNWIQLNGVVDLDGDTRITAELAPGANDNTIRFTVSDATVIDIDSTRLSAPRIIVDSIQLDSNVISTVTADTDLVLDPNGTGSVVIDNFAIRNNVITNTVANSITTFANTNNGYVKFDGTFGLVLPTGTVAQRPLPAGSETGMTRFNTTDGRVEVYNGAEWISVAGAAAGISRSDAENIAFEIVLSLG